jgi:hypothetical protein
MLTGVVARASARQREEHGKTAAARLLAVVTIAGPLRTRVFNEKHGMQSCNFRFLNDFFVGFGE